MLARLQIPAAILALAAPAGAAEKPGDRSITPGQMLGQMAPVDPRAENEAIAAAAARHPLGSAENPVRVAGPAGARDYVSRLRCGDGSRPAQAPHAPGAVGAYGSITEIYPLDCGAAAPGRVALALDLYHEEDAETRAPSGFTLDRR
ncbi:MAG TPA: hypothetical protein VHM92_01095 [Allosphingosinicella sp.]|nr:hypothetical protein [Allosphingosinicella sp.]